MFINKSDKEFILYQESLKNMYIPKENEINPEHIKLELSNLTRELKVLNIFKMYFSLCNKDLIKQIRTHGLFLKCKKTLDIKSKICGRSRYRRFLEVARAAL